MESVYQNFHKHMDGSDFICFSKIGHSNRSSTHHSDQNFKVKADSWNSDDQHNLI